MSAEIVGGVSSQAGLASFSPRPRPTLGDWERMIADEHERGLHGDHCRCTDHADGGTT